MHKRFTKLGLVVLSIGLGACSSISMPFVGGVDETPTAAAASRERSADDVSSVITGPQTTSAATKELSTLPMGIVVATPKLNSGSLALFERGLELLREDRLDAAQVLFEELSQDQPELAGPWVNLAKIHLRRDAVDEALVALNMAIAANPHNCDALSQLGVLARRDGRFEEAESMYQACIKSQPSYVGAYLNLGILYELYMGRLGEALAAYNDYQMILPQPDQQVAGWVIDLERRVASIAQR